MNEQEREASNRRMWIVLGGGAALVALVLALLFVVGKSVDAPLQDFDAEGVARLAGAGVKQASQTAQESVVKATSQGGE